MKIVICSKSCWNVFNFRKNLIKRILSKGNKVYVFSKKDNFQQELIDLGCKTVNIPFDNKGFNIFFDAYVFIKLLIYSVIIYPSFFLSFNIKPIIFCGLISKLLKVKNILMITGLGTAFYKEDLLKRVSCFLYKIAIKNNDHIFFQNQDDLNFFKKNKIFINNNFQILSGSGIDLKYFKFRKYYKKKHLSFLFSGRLLKDKGINEYLYAAKNIKKKYPNCNFRIAGEFSRESNNGIDLRLFNELTKNNVVHYMGNHKDIRNAIIKCDCVVLPSYREGTPRSLLESLAIGRPIITTDAVGCKEVIKNNLNGFVCKVKNSKSLEKAIIKFINMPFSKRRIMSNFSRKYVAIKYDEKIIINSYLKKLYL